jgi:hypothetical protein
VAKQQPQLVVPELQRAYLNVFLEKVIEMSNLGKTQRIRYFGDAPIAVFQQNFGFLQNAFGNDLSSRFHRFFLDGPVQVVNMNI